MKAVTVQPGVAGSVRFEEVPEPDESTGSILVEAVAVGICGTDVEIASGAYGWAPPGRERLVLGHESLGRVVNAGPSGGLRPGDLVVGIVRRPDPVPCPNCAIGEWDMCRNGQYTERGIKQIDGFMSERGATYHSGAVSDLGFEPDVVIECTGVGPVIVDSMRKVGAGGVVCLTGVGSGGPGSGLSPADVARELVLQNNVIVGSVNANRRHFYRAAEALAAADRAWLAQLISRRVPPADIADTLQRDPDDIKVVVDFGG